jgi:F-type H+-transporting ATPase subunit a
MGAFFEAFSVDFLKLGFQVINFLILLFLLNRFLFKPILARLDDRSAKISKGLEDSSSRWRGYVGLILGFFLTILVANWIGLLPGVGTIGITHIDASGHEAVIPIVRPASADLNFTLGLALVAFVMFVYWGIKANGPGGYLKELLGEPLYMAPLMFPINLISEFSRLISLSMRLFGNVFAGEVLLATMIALAPILIPAVFLGLEVLFGFVQALVFALLAMTYIATAIAEHHTSDHGEADAAGADHPTAAEPAHA